MTTEFIIKTEYSDYLKLTAEGKIYYFQKSLTIEHNCEKELTVEIENMDSAEYMKQKNIVLRILWYLFAFFASLLIFFLDNESGFRSDKGFYIFNPFRIEKKIKVLNPEGKTVEIEIQTAKYKRNEKSYIKPDITVKGETIEELKSQVVFSKTSLKKEWCLYYLPVFVFGNAFMLLVLIFGVMAFVGASKQGILPLLAAMAVIILIVGIILLIIRAIRKAYGAYLTVAKNEEK